MKPFVQELHNEPVEIPESEIAPPIVTWIGPDNWWRLEEPYECKDGAYSLTIPDGFEFNMASVPRALWWIIGPFELSVAAPLVHDFMYQKKGQLPQDAVAPPRNYSRREADGLFRNMMAKEGVRLWRRVPAYLAVRAFGWLAWKAWQVRQRPAADGRRAPSEP